ncbi:uncharacterized protein [Amphiura filiformis]|uniref:uncharacterized protein n=1 Tax=Amphiura filiformis TaxID=82378 RepID=UPI003B22891E
MEKEVLVKMMAMRRNRHRKVQNGGLLQKSQVPFEFIHSAGNHTDLSESRQISSGFHFPSLNNSLGKMSNSKKKAPPSTAEVGFSESSLPEIEGVNLDDELLEALKLPLIDVSRQRLRAIQISFRRLGNLENQITAKELNSVLSEHNIKMPGRTFQLILRKFEGKYGVDFEPLWKFMVQAQSRTGRDSVIANNRSTNGLNPGQNGIAKEDIDLIQKLHKALKGTQYDLASLRVILQENDDSDHGVIPRKKIRGIFVDQRLPLPGPSLNMLIKRCDDEKDGMINWAGCVNLLDQAIKFDPKVYEKQNQPRKYQPLSLANKTETENTDASSGSPSSSGAKSQAAKKKTTGGKDGGDKKAGDKDGNKKSQQDSKSKPVSKDSSKTENSKPKSARPTTAAASRPKTATTRPGTSASSDSKSSKTSDKDKTVQKKDGGSKGQSSNKEDGAKKKPSVRSSPELNESSSGKSTNSSASKSGETSIAQRTPSGKKPNDESKKSSTENKSKETDASVNNSKGKTDIKSSNANKYTKSTLGGIADLTKGLSLASDDTEKEYLKQAQARINSPAIAASKDKQKKVKDDVNNKSKAKVASQSSGYGTSSRPKTNSASDEKKDSRVPPKDSRVPPKAEHVPRPSTANVTSSRPMTARPVPPRPATAKPAPPRPTTALSEGGRARSSTGKKVVLSRDMEIDFNKVECIGISKEKKESLISIYTGVPLPIPKVPSFAPVKKNSVVPENFPGKNNSKGNVKRSARDVMMSQSEKVTSLDSSQDSSAKSSSGSKSPDMKVINSSSNSLQSTSSSQASNASSDQPLLSSSETAAKEAAKEKKKKEKEEKEEDGKLFKSFKGFLGMGKKKEEPDDKKKLLEIESMSNNSQEGIELRSAAELLGETGEPEKKQGEPQAETPPDQKPPGPPQNSPEKPSSENSSEISPTEDECPASDPEKAAFMLHGKTVSYYIPDEFIGKGVCGDAPKESLQLDWVYGYRGNDCRCNMYVLKSGELVYFMGRIAILYDGQNHVQRHYMEHTTDIRSLAVHSNQVTIATGQAAGSDGSYIQACIRIWKSDTLETLHVLGEDDFEKTVISISFASTMPNYLVAVDSSDGHTVSIWDSESGKRIAEKKMDIEVVCQVVFHPKRHQELISIGKEHMAYWSFRGESSSIAEINKADYQTNMKAKYIICLAFKSNGDLVTGDSNGTVYVWANGGNTITQTIRHAHEGPVFSLLFHKNSLITGGRDGAIQAWKFTGPNGDQISKMQIPSTEGGVRMLQIKENTLYIGTTLNGIMKAELNQSGTLLTDAKLSDKPLTRGHYDNAHQVVAHPGKSSHFITAGFDGTLMLFDVNSHSTIWKHSMKGVNIQSVDINPSGSLIALGTKDSNLVILSIKNNDEIVEECNIKLGKAPITCIKFSPDGDMVAIGSTDSIINIMRISNDGKNSQLIGKCKGHTGAITGFDWSVEKEEGLGYLLRSSTATFEYSIWNVTTCKQVDDVKQQKNKKWMSHNCLTGFHVAGAWGSLTESPMLSTADRCRDQALLVAGDSTGDIMIYRYPCVKPEASSNTVSAHSTATSCVRFIGDNQHVLSVGGADCTLMQWKIVKT